jgi:hypothetical protein
MGRCLVARRFIAGRGKIKTEYAIARGLIIQCAITAHHAFWMDICQMTTENPTIEDETTLAVSPRVSFDWPIYADATLAGLSTLIPLPLVDLFFEWLFRRRMLGAIARRNNRQLHPQVAQRLNRGRFGCWPGCFMWPVTLIIQFIKRLYRTVLYFLTVKSAADRLSYYWHRAFLLDYMIRRGDLDGVAQAELFRLSLL